MLTTVLICTQRRLLIENSPARNQIIDELRQRGSEIVLFYAGRIKDIKLKAKIKANINVTGMLNSVIRNKIRAIKPDIVICSTWEDAEICFPLPFIMKNTDFYYYNLEITVFDSWPMKEINYKNIVRRMIDITFYSQQKLKEIIYVKGCRSLVIQDKIRKKISKKHGISHRMTWLIPNSYYVDETIYDEPHKSGLIYSGGIQAMLKDFIDHIDEIGDVEITIAGRDCRTCISNENPNIKFVNQNLSEEEYTKFISAYDIALIWYSKTNDNLYYIGLSSGKMFKHLSIGQPIIVNNIPGLAEEVEKYKLGVVVHNVRELSAAVQTITADYDSYVKNIRKVYRTRYDYRKVSKKFFDSIISHAKTKKGKNQ